jgi:drug/metabolite transporter (DMT)-like permease
MPNTSRQPKPWAILLAFAAVYFVWGSTYLAMRVGVRSIPPFLLGATRFFFAGTLLWVYHLARGQTHLARGHWKQTALSGLLLLVGGNGAVVWSLQYIPSGLAALVVGTVPLWIVAIEWVQGTRKPTTRVIAGLFTGISGMAVLLGPDVVQSLSHASATKTPAHHALGIGLVLFASLSWSVGSMQSRRTSIEGAPFLAAGMQTLSGGALLALLSFVSGEWRTFSPSHVQPQAIAAVAFLVVFGSLIAYSAYIWLLQVVPPARVATYAFVNPVVAVLLGCLLLGEPLSPRMIVAAALIVGAVALITTRRSNA